MPDVPADSIEAAERAVEAVMTDPEFRIERSAAGLARAALDAAAPVLAEAVANKILAHMQAHGPETGTPLGGTLRRAWRRHFYIAARVASFAFDTEDDVMRKAAEAIARGDVVVCSNPEPGGTDDGH